MEHEFSHLNAIDERLFRAHRRFLNARTEKDRQFTDFTIRQIEKERASEIKFLGLPEVAAFTGTDDELLAELAA